MHLGRVTVFPRCRIDIARTWTLSAQWSRWNRPELMVFSCFDANTPVRVARLSSFLGYGP